MLALDGARLRRSLATTKQDCSDRYQLPPPSSRSQSNCTHGQEMAGALAAFGISATTGSIILSVLANERFPRQPVIRIVDPHAVVLVRENYI